MYGEDSFFALTPYGQVGLGILSLTLGVLMVAVTRLCTGGWPWVVRLMLALVLLWVFIWVSPQIYYTYYRFLFVDLPVQSVIGMPPPLGQTLRVITFTGPATLSHHGQGLLGLIMVIAALRRKRDTSDI
ncbi:MAG: hypothetical protein AB8B47_16270 [Roseobacter sp.]